MRPKHVNMDLEALRPMVDVPDIETKLGMMHTLFILEDLRGLTADIIDGEAVLRVAKGSFDVPNYNQMMELLKPWAEQSIKYRNGEITKDEYDEWRYTYPEKIGFPWVKTIPEIR